MSISLCQFWNYKSIPLQILYPFSVSWKITPLYLFSSKKYILLKRSALKWKFLRLSSARVKNLSNSSYQFWNDQSITFQILHHSSLTWHITPLWIVSSYFFYFGLRDPIKVPILKLSSALVKICHILHFIFQTTKKYSLYFLGQTLNTLRNRGKWKCNFWSESGQTKFRQILIIFETKDQFFFKFCINLQGHEI